MRKGRPEVNADTAMLLWVGIERAKNHRGLLNQIGELIQRNGPLQKKGRR